MQGMCSELGGEGQLCWGGDMRKSAEGGGSEKSGNSRQFIKNIKKRNENMSMGART